MLREIALWIDDRVHLSKLFASTAGHHVPASSGSWFYVFGSGTLLCFVLQIVTGTCLAFVYVPSASEAYTSLEYLTYQQSLSWFLRAVHNWGSNFMVAIIAGETLSRFFTLHVFIIPGLIIALISLHLRLVLAKGINEYPTPGTLVNKETYAAEYESLLKKEGVPFYPKAISKDLIFSAVVILGILGCAAYFGPKGPTGVPDPTQIDTVPRPDFFFLWMFSALALLPDYMETVLILTAPVVIIGVLFALPFISGTGEKSAHRRPGSVLTVIVIFLTLGTLIYLGTYSPWSPVMNAWSANPTPVQYVKGRSPLELQGALILQNKQCRNCHSLGGSGG